MTTSIISNSSAYSAQHYLKVASEKSSASISRLSSGQRIIKASDDVAALSIGTILRTNVSSLKTALSNTQQANSMLQIADGGLKNIGEILQRQKSLAVQANAGTLSSPERAYLDQEFQNLTKEIDRLVESTKFNSVQLLNGNLSRSVGLNDITVDGTTSADTTTTTLVSITTNGNITNGDKIKIAGVTVEFSTATTGSSSAKDKVLVGANSTETIVNLADFLNTKNDARFAGFRFSGSTNTLLVASSLGKHAGNLTVTSEITTLSCSTAALSVTTAQLDSAGGVNGIGLDRTFAVGAASGQFFTASGFNNSADSGFGVRTNGVFKNAAFMGKSGEGDFGEFSALYISANNVVASVKVGNISYVSSTINLTTTTATDITFTGYDDTTTAGGAFVLRMRGNAASLGMSAASQADADVIAGHINDGLSNVRFQQVRDISSFVSTEIVYDDTGQEIAKLNGASVDIRSDNFDDLSVESVSITAPSAGSSDSVIKVVINGETYSSYSGIGTQIDVNGTISLSNESDRTKSAILNLGAGSLAGFSTKGMLIDTRERADKVAAALERAFGIDSGAAKIQFQTGTDSTDSIGVEIKSAATSQLFDGESLNLLTTDDAIAAGTQLDKAITTVTALRANLGAIQSRFNFAGANLEVSIQNQDAARGVFLDADISSESTSFANSQVLLQASISVLAQANQLPQSLLKLIG